MNSDKQLLVQELAQTRDSLLELVQPIAEAVFFQKPNHGGWSVADIVEHLCLIEEAFLREFFLCLHLPDLANPEVVPSKPPAFTRPVKARDSYWPIGRFSTKETAMRVFATTGSYSSPCLKKRKLTCTNATASVRKKQCKRCMR